MSVSPILQFREGSGGLLANAFLLEHANPGSFPARLGRQKEVFFSTKRWDIWDDPEPSRPEGARRVTCGLGFVSGSCGARFGF